MSDTPAPAKFDVAIIGSGIGGSTLASILARQGLAVVVFEGGVHPRFAIGESMILETSEMMRALADFYDVPELASYSSESFASHIGTQHGVKRHFSFLHHTPGEHVDARRSLQAVIPRIPYGHELHIFRQDADYFLTSVAISRGAIVMQGVTVEDVTIDAEGVTVITNAKVPYRADYLVDASGMKSLLANKLGWRHRECMTHSRTLFTHMIDVPCFNRVGPSRGALGHPFRMSEGTLHHVFRGGWLWVIPFNNHANATNPLCSVGLQLDPRLYPERAEITAEAEFMEFIRRFPDIHAQLAGARAVRNWQRIGRLQYSARHVVTDRAALLAHAAGFIDPLFSKGLYVTHASIFVLADLLLKAKQSRDFSAQTFAPLEVLTLNSLGMHDRLVASTYKSWSNYALWNVYAVVWLLGAYLEYVRLVMCRYRTRDREAYLDLIRPHRLAGGGFGPFFTIQERIDGLMDAVDPDDALDVERTVAEMRRLLEGFRWMPTVFRDLLNGKNHLPDNALRLSMLNPDTGFLGSGEFREHLCGQDSMYDLLGHALRDQWRYSAFSLRRRRRSEARLAWQDLSRS